jgi:hypothetical protein
MLRTTFAVMTAGAAITLSVGLASPAFADNTPYYPNADSYLRVCSGNEIPTNSHCRTGGPQGTPLRSAPNAGTLQFTGGTADELPAVSPGANPYIPIGVGN